MRGLYRFVFKLALVVAIMHLVMFLASRVFREDGNFTKTKKIFMDTSSPRRIHAKSHVEATEPLMKKESRSERLVTAKPPPLQGKVELNLTQDLRQKESRSERLVTAKPPPLQGKVELNLAKDLRQKESRSERLVTAKPPPLQGKVELNLAKDLRQEKSEDSQLQQKKLEKYKKITKAPITVTKEPPFIPYGPDETPVGQPARIPKRFPIEEANFCKKHPGLDIIAYVHSSISGVKRRAMTRATWASATAQGLGVKLGVVFMVGQAKNAEERAIVREESAQYHDIVQGEYREDYRLLTYKGLASLYWINKHCPDVPWTMHADDDTHIDIFQYYEELQKLEDTITEQQFICRHMYGPALRSGRWRVSYEEYPKKEYPLYCSGGVWFLLTKNIPRLLEASKSVPFLWVDDAYITGLLAKKAGLKQYPFQSKYGDYKKNPQIDLGSKVVWFVLPIPRDQWWKTIVDFHKNKDKNKKGNPLAMKF